MSEHIARPRLQARIAGLLYLSVIVTGGFAFYVDMAMIVSGDAAATAANIVASEQLFRLGFAANIVATIAYIAVIAILYELLKPVNRTLSLVAAGVGLAGCAMASVLVHQMSALYYLGDASYLAAFDAEQNQALARVSLRLNGLGSEIGLAFFGCYCALIGSLIIASRFLPRLIGVLLIIGGLCYLINSFADFLAPGLALPPFIVLPAFIAEAALCLWLIFIGVAEAKWHAQAGGQPASATPGRA